MNRTELAGYLRALTATAGLALLLRSAAAGDGWGLHLPLAGAAAAGCLLVYALELSPRGRWGVAPLPLAWWLLGRGCGFAAPLLWLVTLSPAETEQERWARWARGRVLVVTLPAGELRYYLDGGVAPAAEGGVALTADLWLFLDPEAGAKGAGAEAFVIVCRAEEGGLVVTARRADAEASDWAVRVPGAAGPSAWAALASLPVGSSLWTEKVDQ